MPAALSSSDAAAKGVAVSPRNGRAYAPLRGRSSFKRVFRGGTRRRVGGLTVITVPGDPGRSRVGVVASRSVGSAVQRNRAKRRIREALAPMALPEAIDAIVVASSEAVTVQFAELVKWLESAFRTGDDTVE